MFRRSFVSPVTTGYHVSLLLKNNIVRTFLILTTSNDVPRTRHNTQTTIQSKYANLSVCVKRIAKTINLSLHHRPSAHRTRKEP